MGNDFHDQGSRSRTANVELRKKRAKEKLSTEKAKGVPLPAGGIVAGQAYPMSVVTDGSIDPTGNIKVLSVSKTPSKSSQIVASSLPDQNPHLHHHQNGDVGGTAQGSSEVVWNRPAETVSTNDAPNSQSQPNDSIADSDTSLTNCKTLADVVSKTIGTPCKEDALLSPSAAAVAAVADAAAAPTGNNSSGESLKSPKRKSHTPRKGVVGQPRLLGQKPQQVRHLG